MPVNAVLQKIASNSYNEGAAPRRTIDNGEPKETFGDMIKKAINSVDGASKDADQKVADIVSGKSDNVADAMIAMRKAELSFQLMVQVRNKAIETYKELSRMQM